MNTVNRLLIVLQLLIALVLLPILIFMLLFMRANLTAWLDAAGKALGAGPNAPLAQLACVSLALIGFILALLFLVLEMQRPAKNRLRVQIADGAVEVTADAIVHRLEQNIAKIADVVKVKPSVSAARKGDAVDVFLELETGAEVNVPQKTQEVIGVAKQVMEEKLGLKVGKIQVKLDQMHEKK